MDRKKKNDVVLSLRDEIANSSLVVLIHYRGLDAQNISNLRKVLRKNEATLQVAKNTLMRLAIKDTRCGCLEDHLSGPTAVSWGKDPVGLAKALTVFAKENDSVKILIGCLEGETINVDSLENLAKLGSLQEVRARFVGALNAVPSKLVRLVNAPSSKLVTLFGNYVDSKK